MARWRPRPASWPWLAVHEARLLWRMQSPVTAVLLGVVVVVLFAVLHVLAWIAMRHFDLEIVLAKRADLVILLTLVIFFVVLSTALGLSVTALFHNRDQELIMASPVRIRDVYVVRGLTVAVVSVALPALFFAPFANMGALRGHWGLLAAYPAWLALGATAAAFALACTLGLARVLGPRRGYRAAQMVGAMVAMIFVIVAQLQTVLPRDVQARVHAWTESQQGRSWLGPHSLLTWPARALAGDPLPALAIVLLGAVAFLLVVRTTTSGFVSASQEDPGVAPARGARGRRARPFRAGLAAVVVAKELKLIWRDPTLMARALLQVVAFVPLMIVLVRKSQLASLFAGSLVLLATMLGGVLAWITISGEEAPDLLGSAPVDADRLRWLKVAAALAPVAVLCVPFLAWYAVLSLRLFAIVALFLALSLASAGVIQVWTGLPGSGRDLRVRNRKNWLANLVEAFATFGWAGACYLTIAGWYLAAVPVAATALLAPGAAWLIGRSRRGA